MTATLTATGGADPGGLARTPVPVTATAHCLRCDWTAGPGTQAAVDRAADKHTSAGHPTATIATPGAAT